MPKSNSSLSALQRPPRFGPGRSMVRKNTRERGRRYHNIWYLYSPRLGRDVVLKSDVEYEHFCWTEADPRVVRYELEPSPVAVVIDQQVRRTRFDAFVEFRSSPPELREVKYSEDSLDEGEVVQREAQRTAAAEAGFRYVRITKADLAPHAQLIRNWRYALAYQSACRGINLKAQEQALLDLARRKHRCTLDELLLGTDSALRSRYLAALFGCLQHAQLHSDVHANPLCANTHLWMPEASHED